MRIKSIQLAWFRGAADPISLEPDCKSMVVYGLNGSGKSSFVDAVEYVIKDGAIFHLSHEYSGSHNVKAISNTHKPQDRMTELSIKFQNESVLKTEIKQNGSSTTTGAEEVAMRTWQYRQTVLRQDEVAAFIRDRKADKYSALLPLFGLDQMEVAADNLRKLTIAMESESNLANLKAQITQVQARQKEVFGADSYDQMLKTIGDLHGEYCPESAKTHDAMIRCNELVTAIDMRLAQFSAELKRHMVLQELAKADLQGRIVAVRDASVKLARVVEPLIVEKLEVLQASSAFVDKVGKEQDVDCPACGQAIHVADFNEHVKIELEGLRKINDIIAGRKKATGTLCDTVRTMKANLRKPDLKSWRDTLATGPLAGGFAYLDGMDLEKLRTECDDEDLQSLQNQLLPLISAAATDSKDAPPEVQAFSTVKGKAETVKSVIAVRDLAVTVARVEALIKFITELVKGIREEIRRSAQEIIDDISTDIRVMWEILHPGEPIEDVRIYLTPDADKAIDISLKFHGVEQDSPRITLSEGYRNSLGLCIFLALAKRVVDNDRPLFLDDVVVSMDRSHRGQVLELLKKEFSERQVVILTHDRVWYTEMRQQLEGNHSWNFKTLLPYETPDIGIRWSNKTTTFDEARAQINERPDSAGNDARKIMDVELSLIAERLRIRLPYLRSERNDMRMAHEFLLRLVADGKKCFEKREGNSFTVHEDAIEAWGEADRLLISWANRGSHTHDLSRQEAIKLIDSCEKAIEFFKCSSCPDTPKFVWSAEVTARKRLQCPCGGLRWQYGLV